MSCDNHLTSPSRVRDLLKELELRPSKARGQNFLIDKNILDILIRTAELTSKDNVLEVGPGLGVVTKCLLRDAGAVVAVEKDHGLFDYLQSSIGSEDAVTLICADALDWLTGAGAAVYTGITKVVSNLPYSVGSRIIMEMVKSETLVDKLVVTVQYEVAERIAAVPDNGDYGVLSVWTQLYYDVQIVKAVSPNCFWPRPDVKSGIVSMSRSDRQSLEGEEKEMFYYLTKHAFSHRRKQLATILSNIPERIDISLDKAKAVLGVLGLDDKVRPENLTVDHWCSLASKMLEVQ